MQEEWDEKIRLEKLAKEDLLKKQEEERLEEERQKAKSDKDEFLRKFETKVIFDGIHTLVPCTLGYKKKEIEVYLLMDTGCTVTAIHEQAAKKLKFRGTIKTKAKLAGGQIVNSKMGKLSYFKVGPYKIEDFYVDVMKYKGPKSQYDGLLGMDFLAGRKYNIDYLRRVIRWVP